ncbi:hypothetical protein BC826DRAFT_1025031 [Russula brevipes]|nr:hypothetical protein BC826DRAFT_1025031 [Russula brevipes]
MAYLPLAPRIAFYRYNKQTGHSGPESIVRRTDVLTGTAPKEWWCYDIVEQEGADMFREIVGEVKKMCENVELKKSKARTPSYPVIDSSAPLQNKKKRSHSFASSKPSYSSPPRIWYDRTKPWSDGHLSRTLRVDSNFRCISKSTLLTRKITVGGMTRW